jgi:Xaa-Pro aminopeptidase
MTTVCSSTVDTDEQIMCPDKVILGIPQFSLAERDRRYMAVRMLMKERNLDCLIVPHSTGDWDNYQPETRYLTCLGGGGLATAVVFPIEGNPIAAIREPRRVDWWRASQEWISDIRFPPKFRWAPFFAEALKELGADSGKVGVVGLSQVLREPDGIVSYGEFTALREALPRTHFESATELLYRARKRKSAEEITVMERAQKCADAISNAFRSVTRAGVGEHEVYAEMIASHVRTGGELPSMILFSAGRRVWQTQLLPTFRNLDAEDVVVVEAEPKYYGYMAQAIDTVSLRPLSSVEARLFEISHECFHILVDALRPGISYADLISRWESMARKAGCIPGRTMGHGLGLGQDRPLTTPGGKAEGMIVEEGDCFVLKPWMSDEDDVTSVRVGGTVVVGHQRARRLGNCELRPLVLS